ncbi:MAG: trypsin-like peptidase domain-containing protein [Bacteroidetes bacterium]|nr:trypsin-like peptidase domain-containing protein [Bacteroidota bacterium]MBU1581016.1 trypsin-like peptidase domain-containing protein [Bacteroidota bacterium]MBU2559012.1 trypsin-like peptidase domain-containing protein [Bacteroidota bacterium]
MKRNKNQVLRNLAYLLAGVVLTAGIISILNFNGKREHIFLQDKSPRTQVQPDRMHARTASFVAAPQDIDFVSAAEKTVNAVVHIRTEMVRRGASYDDFFGSLREYLYGNPHHNPAQRSLVGFGSGVVLSADGYIVTNNHVVEGADKIEVTFNDKRKSKAIVIGTDPNTDLALIKVDAEELHFLEFGNSDDVQIGEWVLAVGNPFNLTSTVTAGIVSAKARNINILGNRSSIESFIQTDAVINRGNSGGALVNNNGELIGINAAIASHTGVYEGYSFAIPANIVRKVVDDLILYGEPQRAFIGIEIREMTADLAKEIGREDINGVFVAGVMENGGAAEAGIDAGDVITYVDDVAVNTLSQLLEVVGQHRPGDEVTVSVIRDGKEYDFQVLLKNREGTTEVKKREEAFFNETLGVSLARISNSDRNNLGLNGGLKVTNLEEGILMRGGISEGFVIVRINGKPVDDKASLESALNNKRQNTTRVEGMYPNGMKISFEFFD